MECGVPPYRFWDLTLLELLDVIEAKQRRRKTEIYDQFVLADAIASRIGYIFGDPKKRTSEDILLPWDVYPDIFKEDKEKREEKEMDVELERHKLAMERRRIEWNNRRKGESNGS